MLRRRQVIGPIMMVVGAVGLGDQAMSSHAPAPPSHLAARGLGFAACCPWLFRLGLGPRSERPGPIRMADDGEKEGVAPLNPPGYRPQEPPGPRRLCVAPMMVRGC
jgi:hypothetical protein